MRMSYDFRVAVKVFINGQFSLLAQAMTWWIYKQHNIVLRSMKLINELFPSYLNHVEEELLTNILLDNVL